MSANTPHLDTVLAGYLKRINPPEPPVLQRLREETRRALPKRGGMHLADLQIRLLVFLARLTDARRCLEIGVFTGYSSTALALALPDDGELTACDINITYTDTARRYWQEAGVADKITLHLQPALITLKQLAEQGRNGYYDLAFIDADKEPTEHYFEACLQLVRPGGLILIDNLLSDGRAAQTPTPDDSPSLAAVRRFGLGLPEDRRVHTLTLPLGDGLTLLQKK